MLRQALLREPEIKGPPALQRHCSPDTTTKLPASFINEQDRGHFAKTSRTSGKIQINLLNSTDIQMHYTMSNWQLSSVGLFFAC
jgi:hypothetical protein